MSCTLATDLDGLASTTAATSGAGGERQGAGGAAVTTVAATVGAGGTAGAQDDPCAMSDADLQSLALNELAPDGEPDWIELKNCGSTQLTLCGVVVTQNYDGVSLQPGSYYAFAEGALEPGAWLVLERDVHFPFGLSKDTVERFTLLGPERSILDETEWNAGALPFDTAHSWARVPDCAGAFTKTSPPSAGASNL